MAARGINKVILIGHLGQDPEVRYMSNGGAVSNINIATSDTWKDKNTGENKEKTEWHRVVIFGKLAEIAGQYLKKGSQVYIEGSLQTRKWQDQNGLDRYITEIIVNVTGTMHMLGQRNSNQSLSKESLIKNDNLIQKKSIESIKSNIKKNDLSEEILKTDNLTNDTDKIDFDEDIPF